MASVQGVHSLPGESEETSGQACDPCKYHGLQRKAIYFCRDCEEKFCRGCSDTHKGQKMSRNHSTVPLAILKDQTRNKDIVSQKLFTNLTAKETKEINIKTPDDCQTAWITGCVFMPDGQLVLCDSNNRKIKLLDTSLDLQGSLDLPSGPWDISAVNDTTVIITLPEMQQLQYIEVVPGLKAGCVLQLDQMCYGVEVVDGDIYVTCHSEHMHSGDGEVRVLGQDGNVRKRLGMNENRTFMFGRPDYVTVNARSNRIYVSDAEEYTVTCLMSDATVTCIYQYTDLELRWTGGMCVDDEDNIIICGVDSNNVHVVTTTGKKHSILLTFRDGIKKPCSVAYRREDSTMIIGFPDDKVLICNFAN